jgi:hypothetical protein
MTPRSRAPRVLVPNNEPALVEFSGNQIIGTLCKLSTTGGSIRLRQAIPRGTLADITVRTCAGRVHTAIEFLRPMAGAQPFRFVALDPSMYRRLNEVLTKMRKEGHGEGTLQPLLGLGKRAMSAVWSKLP